ncbi:MAG TPA: cytochrome c3 family protein [Rhodocyclaceae bacterium]|nr:cytochrome c3 family protein [Rhodocyclaceae bacterium]
MPQAFSLRADLVVKLVLIALLVMAFVLLAFASWSVASPSDNLSAVLQPIPFSHKHHVGDDGIDCRYCHTTVENSSSAGMPSTDICLSCHSQLYKDAPLLAALRNSAATGKPIAWNRVYDLPDFVFFNHSVHVAKGVACIECHGRVDQMPLMWRTASLDMQWCLACHRDPAPHLHPASEVFQMKDVHLDEAAHRQLVAHAHLESTRRLTDCSTCHR